MKKSFYLVSLFLIQFSVGAQDLIDQMSKEICSCLKENNVEKIEDMNPCMEKTIVKELSNVLKYYKVESVENLDWDLLGSEVGGKLIRDCEYMAPFLAEDTEKSSKPIIIEDNLDCTDLKKGEFYFTQANQSTKSVDTTFVTINDLIYMTRTKNGRHYSIYEIEWKDNCAFDLVFKESNDPFTSSSSQVGDRYNYQVYSTTAKSYKITLEWKGNEYQFEMFKAK